MPMRLSVFPLCLLLSWFSGPAAARPSDSGDIGAYRHAHVRQGPNIARSWRPRYQDIVATVARITPGRILRIRTLRRGGRAIYQVRVLRPDGRRRDILLDAVTLAVVER